MISESSLPLFHCPSWPGGVAAPVRRKCEASEAAQTGWWFRSKDISVCSWTTTPSAPSKEATRYFSWCRVHPSWPGGAMARLLC